MYPWIHSVLQSNAVNATLVPSTGGMKRHSAQTYGLDIQVIYGSSKIYLGAGKTATIEIADPVADRAVWTKEPGRRCAKVVDKGEMVSISFDDKLAPVSYPKEVLRISSVFRNAMDLTSPALTPQDESGSKSLKLPDARRDMIAVLNLMWGSIRPSGCMPSLVPAEHAVNIVQIADKYDVSAVVHNVYTSLILRVGLNDPAAQFNSLVYAIKYGDPWLCTHILSASNMEDPVYWTRSQVELIGYEIYFVLLKAFPRPLAAKGAERDWKAASGRVKWSICAR